jgi:hypothetical protein
MRRPGAVLQEMHDVSKPFGGFLIVILPFTGISPDPDDPAIRICRLQFADC